MSEQWVTMLRDALDNEFGEKPRLAALATTDIRDRPRARMVVCRRLLPDGTTWYTSDGRSAKNEHLRRDPWAEVAFWLPGRREQFRVLGLADTIGPADDDWSTRRLTLWRELSDAARALFAWPPPGQPRVTDPAAFPERIAADVPPPANFEMIVLEPHRIERLALTPHPHDRHYWWRTDHGWRDAALNP